MRKNIFALIFSLFIVSGHIMASDTMVDSGINYKEAVKTIVNPGMGSNNWIGAWGGPGGAWGDRFQPSNFVLYFIHIGRFSSAANGKWFENGTYVPGEDYPLDEALLNHIRNDFRKERKYGSMINIRFRYDDGGADAEPATFEMVLRHVKQLKPIFEEFQDIIAMIESGFVGQFGEQHGTKYSHPFYKIKLLDTLLNVVPEHIPICVRTPDTFAHWAGVRRDELHSEEAFERARNSKDPLQRRLLTRRVGIYNDCIMGSWNDVGTFNNRQGETEWLGYVAPETYYGGEFCNFGYPPFDPSLPQNAIPEFYRTGLSYLHSGLHSYYSDYIFTKDLINVAADNSAYYGQNTGTFIWDHIGYRFVLRKCELTNKIQQGETLKLKFRVENTGFCAPVPHTKAYILLEKDEVYIKALTDVDTHDWNSCTVTEVELNMHVPDNIQPGKWKVYFKNIMGGYYHELEEISLRSIQFANDYDIWSSFLGANYFGTVEISESGSQGTNNGFYQIKKEENGPAANDVVAGAVAPFIDAKITYDHEWSDEYLIATEGNNKLYMRMDEDNIYLMGLIPEQVQIPIYNVYLRGANKTQGYYTYWCGTSKLHADPWYNSEYIEANMNNDIMEFRLPFSWLNMTAKETQFDVVSISKTDWADWSGHGGVECKNFEYQSKFRVYNVPMDLVIAKRRDYELKVITYYENYTYQWYKDDVPIEGATSGTYVIKSAGSSDKGVYTVNLTIPDGTSRVFKIATIKDVIKATSSANIINVSKWLVMMAFIIIMMI